MKGRLSVDPLDMENASLDFGGVQRAEPLAVFHPYSAQDVAWLVKAAYESAHGFTVSARGHGHSINGQAMTTNGVVIRMSRRLGYNERPPVATKVYEKFMHVDVWGGELWIDVLRSTLKYGLAPKSWTDYLYLSVGGTLSNAGISGQAFNHGPQISNVYELDVVTGKGELLTCSKESNSELFHAVLGGLGQFGIITRARIALEPAPLMVRWIRVIYSNFSAFTHDQEYLISLHGQPNGQKFDYVEGFVNVDEGLINNWRSSFFSPRNPVKISSLNASGNGAVLYCLEITKNYGESDSNYTIDQEVYALLKKLNFIPNSIFTTDVPYVDFLDRVHKSELKLRSKGLWDVPHPWLNLFVPKSRIEDFDRGVFKGILGNKKKTNGPILIYPMNKNKWDGKTSVVTPNEDVFYLVALLMSALDNGDETQTPEYLSNQNRRILRFCADSGINVKQYLPHYTTQQEWRDHYGDKWTQFYKRKLQFDPRHILATGQHMWEDLIIKAKNAGLDAIDTYVFWNIHEPTQGNYNFEGRYDLVRFIKTVQKVVLYVHLRIGPYVSAEWNFGGFPVWLKYVPGISFRTDNEPFKVAMQKFTQKIVGMMKISGLFESQGGPIILSQIENEYETAEKKLGAAGSAYLKWAAATAVGLNTGVPWVMCKQDDAPDPIINTCNGFYSNTFLPNKPYKPIMWTEAWTGWFTQFGGAINHRPVQDLAFAVARFIQRGGSFLNYYMFHRGTNFGRTSGPFITTSYDYDAPIDEYGLLWQPKYGHLMELHRAIKMCERALVSSDPTVISLGSSQENFGEDISSLEDSSTLAAVGLLEQLNLTRDNSDYLWYITSIDISPSESFFRGGQKPTLFVQSRGHAVHVFINGQLSGSAYSTPENMRVVFNEPVNLHAGTNRIALLSIAVGLPNNGIHFETWDIGILGPVALQGLDQGHKDLSSKKWTYKVGLKGESMNLVSPNGVSSIEWMPGSLVTQDQQPLKWYKAYFDAPMGNEPLALDMKSMGKGQVWINGQSIGRYWITNANGNCGICKYSGTFRASKCQLGCGQPTQHWKSSVIRTIFSLKNKIRLR
ncbi:hypothetical protein ACH5RR_027403 [Cinchona calisaya]|uniref:FAD-binding PCMH-type domain-containing protein n=1 Tax=Cinchona calisaya TaxID=153742 RepID=A0ABD2Z5D8_9GENT